MKLMNFAYNDVDALLIICLRYSVHLGFCQIRSPMKRGVRFDKERARFHCSNSWHLLFLQLRINIYIYSM